MSERHLRRYVGAGDTGLFSFLRRNRQSGLGSFMTLQQLLQPPCFASHRLVFGAPGVEQLGR